MYDVVHKAHIIYIYTHITLHVQSTAELNARSHRLGKEQWNRVHANCIKRQRTSGKISFCFSCTIVYFAFLIGFTVWPETIQHVPNSMHIKGMPGPFELSEGDSS